MNKKYLMAFAVVLCLVTLSVGVLQAHAAGSDRPLILKDGDGTFLGNVIGAHASNIVGGGLELFTTYLPQVDGILTYVVDDFAGTVTFGNKYTVFYTQADCQGTAYMGQSDSLQAQWIREDYLGNFFKKGAAITTTIESTYGDTGCVNGGPEVVDTYEIVPVTLPVGVGNPTLPLMVFEQTLSMAPTAVRKTSNESIVSSAVLQNDDQLMLQLQAGKTYIVDGTIIVSSTSGTPDIRIAFTDPASSDMNISYIGASGGASEGGMLQGSGVASARIPIVANTPSPIVIHGTVVAGSDGNLQLQWAQFAANINAVSVVKGSYLKVTEI